MGATRALLTHKWASGSTTYVNCQAMAILLLDKLSAVDLQFVEDDAAVQNEVETRLSMVKPCLLAQVSAATAGAQAKIDGGIKALRNVGLHADLGCGAAKLPTSGAAAKRLQRGGREQSGQSIIGGSANCKDTGETKESADLVEAKDDMLKAIKSLTSAIEIMNDATKDLKKEVFHKMGHHRNEVAISWVADAESIDEEEDQETKDKKTEQGKVFQDNSASVTNEEYPRCHGDKKKDDEPMIEEAVSNEKEFYQLLSQIATFDPDLAKTVLYARLDAVGGKKEMT